MWTMRKPENARNSRYVASVGDEFVVRSIRLWVRAHVYREIADADSVGDSPKSNRHELFNTIPCDVHLEC
jgi:hypothetical protein